MKSTGCAPAPRSAFAAAHAQTTRCLLVLPRPTSSGPGWRCGPSCPTPARRSPPGCARARRPSRRPCLRPAPRAPRPLPPPRRPCSVCADQLSARRIRPPASPSSRLCISGGASSACSSSRSRRAHAPGVKLLRSHCTLLRPSLKLFARRMLSGAPPPPPSSSADSDERPGNARGCAALSLAVSSALPPPLPLHQVVRRCCCPDDEEPPAPPLPVPALRLPLPALPLPALLCRRCPAAPPEAAPPPPPPP